MSTTVRRLFEQFQPQNYQLHITPSSDKKRFKGSVTIVGKKAGRPSQRITLHQKDLTIINVTLDKQTKHGKESVAVSRTNCHASYDELRIHADELLYPGTYTITIEFEGEITKPMHGLYPCFFEHEGQVKQLLATQFESHHAREVFPCIDEPEAKATFDLTLTVPARETVLANTPIKHQEKQAELLTTIFETTPIMSTYLLAFVVGEIQCVEAQTSDGTVMRTWGTVAQPKDSLSYANDEAVKILEFFTNYFQTPFPLSKCDQVALPDFESGAMENWGLITYREIALLADPHNRSLSSEQYVSMVVAHELSHQWFGNLVTMKWWDDLWLNESFASLMEHVALDALHPDWHQWEQYTASDVITCSSRDIFKDVQSVHVAVNHPDEIGTLFDPAIVYAKGGRLLKMIREYIGDDTFRAGLKAYFTKYAYKNTVGDDLWAELSAASNKDIKALMDPWLDQSGMPVLDVVHTDKSIELTQKRFVLDKDNDESTWPIPLLTDEPLSKDLLLDKHTLIPYNSNKPIIFNADGSGHFLVNYIDEAAQQYVVQAFAKQTISASSRINILNDHLLLARKGDAPLTDALDIVRSASKEPRDAVWLIMARSISTAMGLVEGNDTTEQKIKAFRTSLVEPWFKKLGWDDQANDTPNDIALRQTVLSILSASEHQDILHEARQRFAKATCVERLPAEQRSMIVGNLVRMNEPIIDQLIAEYKSTPNPDVQLAICSGLTSTKNPEVAKQIIAAAFGKEGFVRPQDIFRWYAHLMLNRHTRPFAWEWLKSSWDHIVELFGDSKSLDYFVIYSARPINTPDLQKDFRAFFEPKSDIVALRRNILIALSEIEARVAWRKREEDSVIAYFNDRAM